MSAIISANRDDATASRAREIARREHRSMSTLVANAVAVFTDFSKDLRGALLEPSVGDPADLEVLMRELSALAAKTRFDRVARQHTGKESPPSGSATPTISIFLKRRPR